MDTFDREVAGIEWAYERGSIGAEERERALLELQRDYRDEARESAQRAYDDEMERW